MADLSKIISKLLGYVILLGSFGLKLPIIYNIISKESVVGLSSLSTYSDIPLYITSIVYNYLQNNPFTSYGESIAIAAQNFVIVILFWIYAKPKVKITTIIGISLFYIAVLYISLQLPPFLQPVLVLSNLPLLIGARLPQIIQNFKEKSTGPMSIISTFLSFAGASTRVLTTIAEVGWDFSLLSSYLVAASLSGTLLLQIIFYGDKRNDKKKE